jgi:hypothetical protein
VCAYNNMTRVYNIIIMEELSLCLDSCSYFHSKLLISQLASKLVSLCYDVG